jgi:hypothetical protein
MHAFSWTSSKYHAQPSSPSRDRKSHLSLDDHINHRPRRSAALLPARTPYVPGLSHHYQPRELLLFITDSHITITASGLNVPPLGGCNNSVIIGRTLLTGGRPLQTYYPYKYGLGYDRSCTMYCPGIKWFKKKKKKTKGVHVTYFTLTCSHSSLRTPVLNLAQLSP